MQLIIVESPTKAKTLQKFLGSGYKTCRLSATCATCPESTLGVDIENDFAPKYILTPKGRTTVKELKKEAAAADSILLSTDPTAKAKPLLWHLVEALKLNKPEAKEVEGNPASVPLWQAEIPAH